MNDILRKVALWLLSKLQKRLDPELSKKVDAYLAQAKRLDATNAAAKKDIARLEVEFSQLQSQRDQLHSDLALVELEIEQLEARRNEVQSKSNPAASLTDTAALREFL
jgi:chromosome segregation ATPase